MTLPPPLTAFLQMTQVGLDFPGLPGVLREIERLSMLTMSQIDSRLISAGRMATPRQPMIREIATPPRQ